MSRRRRRSTPVKPQPYTGVSDVRQVIREELSKALAAPMGGAATPISQAHLNQLALRAQGYGGPMVPLPRDAAPSQFGPGVPLVSAPLDTPLRSGRPAPRRWDYETSWNSNVNGHRLVPFTVLRDAADKVSIVRRCIEARKSSIVGLEWAFTIDPTRAGRLAEANGTSRNQVARDLRDKYGDDIERLQAWWAYPDRINTWTFSEWLSAAIEEQLVIDALSVYPHLTLSGDLHSLEIIDGSTILPLLDHRGATPQPPNVAFQQVLKGFPRGDFSAAPAEEVDAQFVSAIYGAPGELEAETDALIYKVRNRRSNSPYGLSNTEQALMDADLWLRRMDWLRSEYAAGVTPEMLVKADSTFLPEQLKAYEALFNDELSGNAHERHRAKFIPAGFETEFPPGLDAKFSPDLDLHVIRLICADFDVLPSSLGFVPLSGLGGSGHQAGEADSELRRGTLPTAAWFTDMINEVSRRYLGMPDELTFSFVGLGGEEDEERQSTILQAQVGHGYKTLNEARDDLNLPRYTFPYADQPMLQTASGPVWLELAAQAAIEGPAEQDTEGAKPKPGAKRDDDGEQAPDDDPPAVGKAAAADEQRQFLTYARKSARAGKWRRDFTFTAVSPEVGEAANRLAEQGDLDAVKALFTFHGDG